MDVCGGGGARPLDHAGEIAEAVLDVPGGSAARNEGHGAGPLVTDEREAGGAPAEVPAQRGRDDATEGRDRQGIAIRVWRQSERQQQVHTVHVA